jgi:hypothetical protein
MTQHNTPKTAGYRNTKTTSTSPKPPSLEQTEGRETKWKEVGTTERTLMSSKGGLLGESTK